MSESHDEKLNRTIRVHDLPHDYVLDDVIKVFETIGSVTDIKAGINEVLLTFSDHGTKEMAKMYDSCSVQEKYTIKIEDASTLNIKTATERQKEELLSFGEKKVDYLTQHSQTSQHQTKTTKKEHSSEHHKASHSEDEAYAESSKEFIEKLNKVNVPVRAALKEDDPFVSYTKRAFILTFTASWSLIWLATSLIF
mmetsp:Transcript_66222/g.76863  ORF Transcript_66222/g.76863 Transcript_66222/m.76863 type:complete len:195 (-) Transcript_66222:155-739(-)|eukprot:CAMPEP_0176435534 /NCGR_PEP_ID=MMETSP0127-20121128/17382_1 /TAXON_ID=938130 /ORGANISM="Platyophrya macrostoma, Strain WH" /LENGTH=194 /DNA_ID=CAMNT_0017818585 /DNA_START=48 /DNA_END=632 /DNA_ORIENTATION=-